MSSDEATPPDGIAPEILAAALSTPLDGGEEEDLGCDAYALWAAMTRLGHEVKLQGRAFAALRERLEEWAAESGTGDAGERAEAVVRRAIDGFREGLRDADRRAEAARAGAACAEEDLLATLTDVHDRLSRGLDAARRLSRRASRGSWLGGLLLGKSGDPGVVDSLVEGQELALRRVADELARRGVREMAVLGERFDPAAMRAVATDSSGEAPDGTVTAVARGGWLRGETVWRPADVAVAMQKG